MQTAADEIVALWRGSTTTPTAHIGSGSVRWETHCTHESANAVFAVTQRDAGELQKKLDDVFVGNVTACDATACCQLAKGKRGFVDALCFDKDAHLTRVREIDDGACHG